MYLDLPTPSDWRIRTHGGWRFAALPSPASPPDLVVALSPLTGLPADAAAWRDGGLAEELPAGTRLEREPPQPTRSRDGWPLEIVEARVLGASGVIELRLGVFYLCGEYGAYALVVATDPGWLAGARSRLLEVLTAGQPRWDDEITALAQVFAELPGIAD